MNIIPWRNKRDSTELDAGAYRNLAGLRHGMDDLFERFFRDPWNMSLSDLMPNLAGFGPRIDITETDDALLVRAELPGIEPKDVEIEVEGGLLSIRGEKREEKETKRKNVHHLERQYGSFHRCIPLPTTIDPDKVEAAFKNGILTLTIAKLPDAKPRKIEIRNG